MCNRRFHGLIYAYVRMHLWSDLIIMDLLLHIEQGDNDTIWTTAVFRSIVV